MRLQFEIPEERVKEIDALVERLGLRTRVQLFNNALTFFEWGIRQREKGNIIASINEANGTFKELVMPVFPSVDAPRATSITTTALVNSPQQANKVESADSPHSPELATSATRSSNNIYKILELLSKAGLLNTQKLLEMGATPKGRLELEEKSGISYEYILESINHADLFRIQGVGEEYADLLEEAGVDSVVVLAQRNPIQLHKTLMKTNQEKRIVRKPPEVALVKAWVEQAKELERITQY